MTVDELKDLANQAAELFLNDKVSRPIDGVIQVLAGKNLTDQQIQRVCEFTNKTIWRKLYLSGDKDRTYGFELVDSKKVIGALKGKEVSKEKQEELARTKGAHDKAGSMTKAASDTLNLSFNPKKQEYLDSWARMALESLDGEDIKIDRSEQEKLEKYWKESLANYMNEYEKLSQVYDQKKLFEEAREEIKIALATRKYTPEEIKLLFDDVSWFEDILNQYDECVDHGVTKLPNPRDRLVQISKKLKKQ